MKIYEENPHLVKIEQKILDTLCKNLHSLLPVTRVTISIVDSDMQCSNTEGTQICISLPRLSVLITFIMGTCT